MFNQKSLARFFILTFAIHVIGIFFVNTNPANANTKTLVKDNTKQWVWPVNGKITDTFGTRQGNHKGLDIAANLGEAILAVSEGKVSKSYYSSTYGNVVFIKHPNGFETVYAHMSERDVQEGEEIVAGQKIGEVGSTGVSTGDHLHFEVHIGEWNYQKSNAIDPLIAINPENTYASITENDKNSIAVSKLGNENEKLIIEVTKNDTLWDISLAHQVSVDSIMEWNKLETSTLSIGQKLEIYSEGKNTYIVQSGDSLLEISKKVGIPVGKIRQLNNIQDHLIYPNQILLLKN